MPEFPYDPFAWTYEGVQEYIQEHGSAPWIEGDWPVPQGERVSRNEDDPYQLGYDEEHDDTVGGVHAHSPVTGERQEIMSEYPQHDKLKAARASTQDDVLGEFIDFLNGIGIRFGKYPEPCAKEYDDGYTWDDPCACDDEGIDCLHCLDDHTDAGYHHGCGNGEYMLPVGSETKYSEWIAEFYGIDYKAFQDEKEALYRSISEAANAR